MLGYYKSIKDASGDEVYKMTDSTEYGKLFLISVN